MDSRGGNSAGRSGATKCYRVNRDSGYITSYGVHAVVFAELSGGPKVSDVQVNSIEVMLSGNCARTHSIRVVNGCLHCGINCGLRHP